MASDVRVTTESFSIGAGIFCKQGKELPPAVAVGNDCDTASHVERRAVK